jgi:hypothetical protein
MTTKFRTTRSRTDSTGKGAGRKPGEVLTGGAIVATPINEEEAKKKYPMPGGKAYPVGDRDIHQPSGWIYSPYTRQLFDCTSIAYGGLVLDTKVNKVFVRPKTKWAHNPFRVLRFNRLRNK